MHREPSSKLRGNAVQTLMETPILLERHTGLVSLINRLRFKALTLGTPHSALHGTPFIYLGRVMSWVDSADIQTCSSRGSRYCKSDA